MHDHVGLAGTKVWVLKFNTGGDYSLKLFQTHKGLLNYITSRKLKDYSVQSYTLTI